MASLAQDWFRERHERDTIKQWLNESNPALRLMFFHPHSLLGRLLCFTPAQLGPQGDSHTLQNTHSNPESQWSLSAANLEQPGWGAVVSWMENLLTDNIILHWLDTSAACFTMEFGRVWSRYQRTMLITMMMFKLGKASTCATHYLNIYICHTSD